MNGSTGSAWPVAGFAAALHVALIVAAFGFLSLFADAEPVPDPAAGRLVGPIIVAAAVAALLVLLGLGLARGIRPLSLAGLAVLVTWLAGALAGTIAYAIATGTLLASVIFAFSFMSVGFGVIIPLMAAPVALLASMTVQAQQGGADRPRWPWERDDDE